MMVELALASSIPVAAWATEDDATIATALQVLADQAAEVNRRG